MPSKWCCTPGSPAKTRQRRASTFPPNSDCCANTRSQSTLTCWRNSSMWRRQATAADWVFAAMLLYLKKHACWTILVEKTDRLYRNLKDWSTLDELGVTIHPVKENTIIGPDSRSAEQFVGIKVLVARNHRHNLSEETQKGMLEKARSGIYPSCASVGYRNVDGPNGKRILAPEGDIAHVITELFEDFRTGKDSVKSLAAQFR